MGTIENAKYIRSFLNKLRHGRIKYNFSQFQILSGILMFLKYDIGLESCSFKEPNSDYKWKKFYIDLEEEYCTIVFEHCDITINKYKYSLWDAEWINDSDPMEVVYDPANTRSKWVFKGTDDVVDGNTKIPVDIFNDIIKALCYAMYSYVDCPVEVLYELFSIETLDVEIKEVKNEDNH